jgi:hypothetical protein
MNKYPWRDYDGQFTNGRPDHPNHLLGSFLVLFPYSKGGFETFQPRKVAYAEHVRWALEYDDRRFSRAMAFLFQVFSVMQKRQVCRFAEIQVSRQDFSCNKTLLKSLKAADLKKAGEEERCKAPFTNPGVHTLRQIVSATRARVMGTDKSRLSLRSKIWGMTIRKNPPNLWITLNFSDTHDPIVQVLAGEQIYMNNFNAIAEPNSTQRAANAV